MKKITRDKEPGSLPKSNSSSANNLVDFEKVPKNVSFPKDEIKERGTIENTKENATMNDKTLNQPQIVSQNVDSDKPRKRWGLGKQPNTSNYFFKTFQKEQNS